MLHRFITATGNFMQQRMNRSAAPALARNAISGFAVTMRHALLAFGIIVVTTWVAVFFKPEFADRLKALFPAAHANAPETLAAAPVAPAVALAAPVPPATEASPSAAPAPAPIPAPAPVKAAKSEDLAALGTARQQQWVTNWLSRRYRVANDATNMLVSAAYMTAREIKLDPLLILSVMAIESGLNPFAESPAGAKGLMQVMASVHRDKFQPLGGIQAALNPVANIKVGSLILKDYVKRTGSVEGGLKMYVGAGASDNDSGYGARVLAEYQRLKAVSAGKKVPISNPVPAAAPAKTDVPTVKSPAPDQDAPPSAEQTASLPVAHPDKPADHIAGL